MVKNLKKLLWPFSLLYGGVMQVRNKLYDQGSFASTRFDIPVIAVGNLTVGGTGKTPHVEYLLRLLHNYKTATLSRGYKRQTKGFILADAHATAQSIGDEPLQYYRDFPGVAVAVAEDRVLGVTELQKRVPDLEVVVLDDALQHRPIQPSLRLLLTDYERPFYDDLVLPAGLLREPRSGAVRADAVIVSKSPENLAQVQKEQIAARIRKYSRPDAAVFFSSFRYGAPQALGHSATFSKELILLTGIANPKPLQAYLQQHGYKILKHLAYSDHYLYTLADIQAVAALLQEEKYKNAMVFTTRKDAVKLLADDLKDITQQLPVFEIPIQVRFLDGQETFDALILNHVQAVAANAV